MPDTPRLSPTSLAVAMLALGVLIALGAGWLLCPRAAASAAPQATAARVRCENARVSPVDDPQLAAAAILCLLNRERTERGLPRLRLDTPLAAAAVDHSNDMVRRRYFAHTTPGNVTFGARIRRARYPRTAKLGENLAWGTGDPALPIEVVRGWMHSPEHRANVLDRDFRAIGIGIAHGVPVDATASAASAGATYTTDFGSR